MTPSSLYGSAVTLAVQQKRNGDWLTTRWRVAPVGSTGLYSWRYAPTPRGTDPVKAGTQMTDALVAKTTEWMHFSVK